MVKLYPEAIDARVASEDQLNDEFAQAILKAVEGAFLDGESAIQQLSRWLHCYSHVSCAVRGHDAPEVTQHEPGEVWVTIGSEQ